MVGELHIFEKYLFIRNEISAFGNCVNDPFCAAESIQGYMNKFGQVRKLTTIISGKPIPNVISPFCFLSCFFVDVVAVALGLQR